MRRRLSRWHGAGGEVTSSLSPQRSVRAGKDEQSPASRSRVERGRSCTRLPAVPKPRAFGRGGERLDANKGGFGLLLF